MAENETYTPSAPPEAEPVRKKRGRPRGSTSRRQRAAKPAKVGNGRRRRVPAVEPRTPRAEQTNEIVFSKTLTVMTPEMVEKLRGVHKALTRFFS